MIYPWQQLQWQRLLQQYQQGQLPHALLLKGSEGLGKVNFARHLAKAILCEDRSMAPCDKCRGCQLYSLKNHHDFYEVALEEKSKIIKVDQIRSLIAALQKTSQHQGYQVAIIYPAEKMNRAAANALLKTLEEPAGSVIIILIASQTALLPATILSRCQLVPFSVQSSQIALSWLQDNLQNSDSAETLLALSQGSPLRALAMETEDYSSLREKIINHLWRIGCKEVSPIAPVTELLKLDLLAVLHALIIITTDLLRITLGVSAARLSNIDRAQKLQALAKPMRAEALADFIPELLRCTRLVVSASNVNVQLLLECLFLKWSELLSC